MNILTDPLPNTISIQGREVAIKTDFRDWLRFIAIVRDYDLDRLTIEDYAEMVRRISETLFEDPPEITYDLFPAVTAFYSGFSNGKKSESDDNKRLFDYEIDAESIYSSFAQVYGIRLKNEKMHWYEFRALFVALPEECALGKLIHIRSMKESDVPKDKRGELRKAKEAVALPVYRSYAEDDEALANLRKALK